MADLRLDFEWTDPLEARGPELRATWARLKIEVGGQVATRAYDRHYRGVRESVFLPLYPLAEWIASNWWFIFGEVEVPGKLSVESYHRRHCVRFGQEGYALPALVLQPVGEHVLVKWQPVVSEWAGIEFLGSGAERVDRASLAQMLRQFIEAVLDRLDDEGMSATELRTEWDAVANAGAEESAFCLASAALGEDPYALSDSDAELLIAISRAIPVSALAEFLPTATIGTLADRARGFEIAIDNAVKSQGRFPRLVRVKERIGSVQLVEGRPWERGYELARRTRESLGWNGSSTFNEDVSEALGFAQHDIAAGSETATPIPAIHGVLAISADDRPGIYLTSLSGNAARFDFARAVGEYLTSPRGDVRLITRAYSDTQRRNRAFAAELLVPAAALRSRVSSDVVSSDAVDELGSEFGVSPLVVKHQLENHGIAQVAVS